MKVKKACSKLHLKAVNKCGSVFRWSVLRLLVVNYFRKRPDLRCFSGSEYASEMGWLSRWICSKLTIHRVKSLYRRIRINKNPYAHVFYIVIKTLASRQLSIQDSNIVSLFITLNIYLPFGKATRSEWIFF